MSERTSTATTSCPTCNGEGVVQTWGGKAIATCHSCDGAGSAPAEGRIPDLMAALEQSIIDAKAARDRHKNGSQADPS